MKNAKMPIQGEGVIRNANRSHIEGGVEASGIFGDLAGGAWNLLKTHGPTVARALLG